ncbi:MAG: histidinol-phosphate transaminase [Bacillota bacterium]|nr:histidinol-phosphate transaminase [Bacillota bacterium]
MLYRTNNPHGGDIYEEKIALDYSSNTNPFGTPQGVLAAMRSALPAVHHYPDPYCRKLVQAIAIFEEVPREYILCGNGAAELIYAYCGAIEAKRAVELAPTFSEYALGLERLGCQVDRYVLQQDKAFDLDAGFLDFLQERSPEAVFLCNPNNPSGRLTPPCVLEEILDFCGQQNIRLFLDECFLDLSDSGISMKGFLGEHPELFILKAFTKSYGMAGVRLGYCLCSDGELLEKMSKAAQPWNVSVLAQAAGVAALQEEQFLMKTKALIPAERRWLKGEMEALGFWVCPSEANYLLFHGKPGLDQALKEYGIAIRNCDNYHGLGSGWYRIAVRLHEQNEQLIAAVRQVCGKEKA